jgi:hypothetical protein
LASDRRRSCALAIASVDVDFHARLFADAASVADTCKSRRLPVYRSRRRLTLNTGRLRSTLEFFDRFGATAGHPRTIQYRTPQRMISPFREHGFGASVSAAPDSAHGVLERSKSRRGRIGRSLTSSFS